MVSNWQASKRELVHRAATEFAVGIAESYRREASGEWSPLQGAVRRLHVILGFHQSVNAILREPQFYDATVRSHRVTVSGAGSLTPEQIKEVVARVKV